MACTVNHKTLAPGEAVCLGSPMTGNEKANASEVPVTVGDTMTHGACDNAKSTCEDESGKCETTNSDSNNVGTAILLHHHPK